MAHTPVLLKEVIKYLNPQSNQNFIDCTINGGGHSFEILKHTVPAGKVLGIDWDPTIIGRLRLGIKNGQQKKGLILVCDNFVNLKEIIFKNDFKPVHGVLLDLGMSSEQIEQSGKGFSFLRDEPLDMRFNPEQNILTAGKIVNNYSEKELVQIFKQYSQERFSERMARIIAERRRIKAIKTTSQLVEIIRQAIPRRYQYGRIHFATRVFQALRIAVNDELNNIKKVLPQIIEVLEPAGQAVIISFHSLEDRIVKNFIREQAKLGKVQIMTKKPIGVGQEEIKQNPRSRSAKLRVFRSNL